MWLINTTPIISLLHAVILLLVVYWHLRRSTLPLMEWNQILWKGNCNFSGLFVRHKSRLVWGCLIIKNEMSRYVQWIIGNWIISQCKHIQMILSYPSINGALWYFYYRIIWILKKTTTEFDNACMKEKYACKLCIYPKVHNYGSCTIS
jgi:hypothetical protein